MNDTRLGLIQLIVKARIGKHYTHCNMGIAAIRFVGANFILNVQFQNWWFPGISRTVSREIETEKIGRDPGKSGSRDPGMKTLVEGRDADADADAGRGRGGRGTFSRNRTRTRLKNTRVRVHPNLMNYKRCKLRIYNVNFDESWIFSFSFIIDHRIWVVKERLDLISIEKVLQLSISAQN